MRNSPMHYWLETAFRLFYKKERFFSKIVKETYIKYVHWFGKWGSLSKNSIVLVTHFFKKSVEKWMSKIWLIWTYILIDFPNLKFRKTFLPQIFWDAGNF